MLKENPEREREMKTDYSITFWAILANIIWATAVLTAKIGFGYLGPCTLIGFRLCIAGTILFIISGNLIENLKTIRNQFAKIALISFFQSFITFLAIYFGLTMLSGAMATIVLGFEPAICAILAHLLMKNDRLTKTKVVGIIVSVIGIVAISLSTQPWTPMGLKQFFGILLIMLGVASAGIGNILILKDRSRLDFKTLNAAQSLISAVPILIFGLIAEQNRFEWADPVFYIVIGWVALISILASTIWMYLLKVKKAKVSYINLWGFLNPVVGTVLCIFLLPNESFSWVTGVGIVVVVASLILLTASEKENAHRTDEKGEISG